MSITWKEIDHETTIQDFNIEFLFERMIDVLKDPERDESIKAEVTKQLMHFGKIINSQVHNLPRPKSPYIKGGA
jgi:hypothetical protein